MPRFHDTTQTTFGVRLLALFVACVLATTPSRAADPRQGKPAVVRVVKNGEGWQLLRNGEPYFIKGAGGDGPRALLARAGGNSIRTWGADKLDALLDEAQRN